MAKNVSSSLRQLLQKMGDKLANRTMTREDFVKAGEDLAKQSRASVTRSWGDQVKNPKKTK